MRPGRARPPPPGKRLRAALMGLATAAGLARRGVFLPCRHAAGFATGGYPALEPFFAAAASSIAGVAAAIDDHAEALRAVGDGPPPAPRWRQGWFPRLDAAAAYVLVRTLAPRRIVEIGSGHSTRFLAAAAAAAGGRTAIAAVDPAPRAALDGLAVALRRAPVQEVADDLPVLAPGDVLFVDSSHLLVPGSDVDIVVNRIWPRLPAGVLVHFHDVFLPDPYPEAWRWRGYNEQLAVAPLISGGAAEIVFSSHFALTRMADALAGTAAAGLPLVDGSVESSLWLRKRAPAG